MFGKIYREQFADRAGVYDVASGWSRGHLNLLFDHLEAVEAGTGKEQEFDPVDMLSGWTPYASPDEFMELNDMTDHVSTFADWDNPEWNDIRNCGRTLITQWASDEAIVED